MGRHGNILARSLLVIPDAEPPGPAFGRPDDRLREAIRNPEVGWIPGSR